MVNHHGFSIQGITLGMSREAVESRLGPGTSESNGVAGYGKAWMETNPFDVERRELEVGYEGNSVVSVTGRNFLRHGVPIKPREPDFGMEEFVLNHSPGVAVREGTEAYDSALMLSYPEAGVHVEYYSEKRMWFTIFAPLPGRNSPKLRDKSPGGRGLLKEERDRITLITFRRDRVNTAPHWIHKSIFLSRQNAPASVCNWL